MDIFPDRADLLLIRFFAYNESLVIQPRLFQRTIVYQYDLVTGNSIEGKDILNSTEVHQAIWIDFCLNLFHQFATNRFIAWFTEFDATTQRTIEMLFSDRIISFRNKDPVIMAEYTNR